MICIGWVTYFFYHKYRGYLQSLIIIIIVKILANVKCGIFEMSKVNHFTQHKNYTKLLNGQETCFFTQTQGHLNFCQVIVHAAKPIPTCELFHVLFFMMKLEGNVQVCKRKKNNVCARLRRNRCIEIIIIIMLCANTKTNTCTWNLVTNTCLEIVSIFESGICMPHTRENYNLIGFNWKWKPKLH